MKYIIHYLPFLIIFTFVLYEMDKDWFCYLVVNCGLYELGIHINNIVNDLRRKINDYLMVVELTIKML